MWLGTKPFTDRKPGNCAFLLISLSTRLYMAAVIWAGGAKL
jgi:hypothetical protein